MKKILFFAALLLCGVLTSCDKEDVGGTATQGTAGQWYVQIDLADEDGNVLAENLMNKRVLLLTYNTSTNDPTEMIVDDLGNIWEFKVKVAVDQKTKTFKTTNNVENNLVAGYEELGVTIHSGKVTPNGGVQNNGSKDDYIEFLVSFDDDDDPTTVYKIHGVRYSGLEEND